MSLAQRVFGGDPEIEEQIGEEGWPCQRLRLGYGLLMFFVFEVTIGRQLPFLLPAVMLGLAVVCLASAALAVRRWKLRTELDLLVGALGQLPSSDEVTRSGDRGEV